MSIKDLFDKTKTYLPQTNNKELLDNVESSKNLVQKDILSNTFVPQIDYSEPENFTKFGSAYLYYNSAIKRIYDYFPYDGSDAEINEFINKSLPHEKYIFDTLYPRTNGYANFDGSSHISFKGGPNASTYSQLDELFKSDASSKRVQANLYETNVYQSDNKPSDYGGGSRESNLKCNFQNGVTVEFWLKGPAPSSNSKQTVFHLTNSSGGDALTIYLSGTADSPFHVSLDNSGTPVFADQQIGATPTTSSLTSWSHYAISFKSASAGITTKFYVDGKLDETKNLGSAGVNTLTQKGTLGYIASGSSGYLSASMDEFRFWKTERDAYQIGVNYFSQTRGGTNNDVSNTTLGVYYKFNEGTTGISSLDNIVLDYAGRITNGTWNGTASRTLESAIVEAGAAPSEFLDPIIYDRHPSVISLKEDLESKGRFYDSNNQNKFLNYFPSWVIEESENDDESQLEKVSHIIGAYFDKLYLQIQAVTTLKQPLYTSSSHKPITFARNLPQSLGLYTPEIFIDSEIINTISNKTEDYNFETKLEDTKNLIYLNLYNNLASIFKSKGTEKAIKGVLRTFYIDDRILRLNTYSNKARYELRNNVEQTIKLNKFINFNSSSNLNAVIYQKQNPSDTTNTIGYISGSGVAGYEFAYGATIEADITFPEFNTRFDTVDRRFTDVSLFGVVSASVTSPDDTTFFATDNTNFQVFAIRDSEKSKNVHFKLTSSLSPNPLPELTSSNFFGVYNDQDWNISVSVIPNKSGSLKFVTGSDDYDYTLRFEGYNTLLGDVRESFSVEETITKEKGENFLKNAKRVYAGAYRQNITGSVATKSDVLVSGVRYWTKTIDQASKQQHALDFDNIGVTDTSQNISALDTNTKDLDVINQNTLALSWEFGDIINADGSGNFYITDFSSGSATIRDNYGWVGSISGYQHSGYGYGFAASKKAVDEKRINIYKFVDPEKVNSSDMVKVVTEEEEVFGIPEDVVSYHHTLEKSMYNVISEEMLKFFAGVADFNNLIGEPVNRYRMNYKAMEKLRQAFFMRVNDVKEVEKFIEYYKWFDDSLGDIIRQLIPASSVMSDNIFDVVESHVLERNKYQSKFPTIEFKAADPETPALGIREKTYDWERGHHPVSDSQRENSLYWRLRAKRSATTITSGDANVDSQRDTFIETAGKYNNQPAPTVSDKDRNTYSGQTYVLRHLSRPYKLKVDRRTNPPRIIKGGTNFEVNKNFEYHRAALHPAGPVNTTDGVFIPKNVLLGFTDDLVQLEDTTDPPKNPNVLVKRNIKIQSGRDWEDGVGYKNMKSDIVFPFNIISSSVTTGYNKEVVSRVTTNVEIVNLHNDVYGDDMEKPMQGPFTEYAVGGSQHRHIKLNDGGDNYLNRPEAWKIALGLCEGVSGAIGMIGADYPYPEANAVGANPYPMTGAQKAYLYRDFVAKRPVNIKNIRHTTGSTILGNYNHNYDVVQAGSAFSTPRQFVEKQPTLPESTFDETTRYATSVRSILDIRRTNEGHTDFNGDYSVDYLHTASGDSVIISRFSAPGGIEVMTRGYQDFRSSTYSVYNALNARNQTVRRSFQGVSSSIVSETSGMRNFDHTGRDFGLMNLSARHSARFFRDSTLESSPGASYDERPSFHRTHRNNYLVPTSSFVLVPDGKGGFVDVLVDGSRPVYDNMNVQHQIPRSDRQYSWISASIVHRDPADIRYAGFMKTGVDVAPIDAPYYVITGTYVPFFDYVSASDPGSPIYQNTTRLNLLVTDEIGLGQNVLGAQELQITPLTTLPEHRRLNALLIRRGDLYGWGNWRSVRNGDHPILRIEHQQNKLSLYDNAQLTSYDMQPIGFSGRPVLLNAFKRTATSADGASFDAENTITFKISHNNKKYGFNEVALNNATGLNPAGRDTSLDDFVTMIRDNPDYQLNWVSYTENILPSQANAGRSSVVFRDEYDNKYWRDSSDEREFIGNSIPSTFNLTVSQSSWPLDPPRNFQTRPDAPQYNVNTYIGGGELQNVYSQYFINTTLLNQKRESLSPAALYARKHMVSTVRSVVSPSGIQIPETGSYISLQDSTLDMFGGEANWEADTLAGYLTNSAGTPGFVSSPSEPWFDSYSDFKSDLKFIAKDYAVVPEFRISEHVSDYNNLGTDARIESMFEIVGTSKNSNTEGFYKDYSNSEFLRYFADIAESTETTPNEIRLVCKAVTRFNPYKGFYPAQRTIDIVEQFASSYRESLAAEAYGTSSYGTDLIENSGSLLKPLTETLFAPGILFNTIKSGLSVDYPILSSPQAQSLNIEGENYVLSTDHSAGGGVGKYAGGVFWDKRAPFEAIIQPDKYLAQTQIYDIEPHPSSSLATTASIAAPASDPTYTKMTDNFFAEIGNFFLKDSEYSTIKSSVIEDGITFESGAVYGARLKMRRSLTGSRTYQYDYDSRGVSGSTSYFGINGMKVSASSGLNQGLTDNSIALPQDPKNNSSLHETFTMYSRTTAFGPAITGRDSMDENSGSLDSLSGYNWSFTPPYYHGEAWTDMIFYPDHTKTYTLEQILSEIKVVHWRVDPGSADAQIVGGNNARIYGPSNVNDNAMQLDSCLNLFGVERMPFEETNQSNLQTTTRNTTAGKRWVIQPKAETPMMDFGDTGPRPITSGSGTLTLPDSFATGSVPRGMWHQFGLLPDSPTKGIFLEIGDIPTNWLRFHYKVTQEDSVYNNQNSSSLGDKLYLDMKSLTDFMGFEQDSVRLGELKEKTTIREAIVAIPYITGLNGDCGDNLSGQLVADQKQFFGIPRERIQAAVDKGTTFGDSEISAGDSVRNIIENVKRYVLPPQFDFVANSDIEPIVMYFFEFGYELDKDDLSYIWQNLAPRDYKKIEKKTQFSAHKLAPNELLQPEDVIENNNLRWMVFKVKQRGMSKYADKIYTQAGRTDRKATTPNGYDISFNWPYDYVSFVEMINMDVEVMMDNKPQMKATETTIAKTTLPKTINQDKVNEALEDKIIEDVLNTSGIRR